MNTLENWVVETKHTKPNDLYVKVDGSDYYISYWAIKAPGKEKAIQLATEAAEELDLGETEIVTSYQYAPKSINNTEIQESIEEIFSKLTEQDVRMGAWFSPTGGIL